jgi:uncharacterized protein (TIGR03067 family)
MFNARSIRLPERSQFITHSEMLVLAELLVRSLRLQITVPVLILCGQSAFADPPHAKLDEKLQSTPLDGVWVLEAYKKYDMELAGDRLPAYLHGHARTFAKHRMTLVSRRGTQEFPFSVNAAAMPKELDVLIKTDGDRQIKSKAIYRIEGDVLQIAEGSPARPASFVPTKKKRFSVYTYRRKKN